MKAESMLNRTRNQILLLRELNDDCLRIFTEATRITPALSDAGGSGSSDQDKLSSKIIKLSEAEDIFEQKRKEYRDNIAECFSLVERVGGLESVVLFRHYFKIQKLTDIAEDLKYSAQHVWNVHGKGIDRMNKILKRRRNEKQ